MKTKLINLIAVLLIPGLLLMASLLIVPYTAYIRPMACVSFALLFAFFMFAPNAIRNARKSKQTLCK